MSVVTNVVLACSGGYDESSTGDVASGTRPSPQLTHDVYPIDQINEWLRTQRANGHGVLASIRPHAGGEKNMECGLFVGAFTYLDLDDFMEAVAKAPWEEPAEVQLFIKEQEDDRFTMYTLRLDRTWLKAN